MVASYKFVTVDVDSYHAKNDNGVIFSDSQLEKSIQRKKKWIYA